MTKDDRDFFNSRESFKDYVDIEEYKADIKRWLTLSSWHYTEEQAEERIRLETYYIKRAFADREPAADAGAEVGYCCG